MVYRRLARNAKNVQIHGVYGGTSVPEQLAQLHQCGCDVLVATPGRLKQYVDGVETGSVSLTECNYMILDEADRMLEMGFTETLEALFSVLNKKSSVMMWTATWPKGAQAIADKYMPEDTVRLRVRADVKITQHVMRLEGNDAKVDQVVRFYEEGTMTCKQKVLLFSSYKNTVKEVALALSDRLHTHGVQVRTLHGDLTQKARDLSMANFRRGQCQFLVASDVAARGIDLPLDYVINFDLPHDIERFMHRIGRTGRAGRHGVAYTFIDSTASGSFLHDLVEKLRSLKQEVPNELLNLAEQNAVRKNKSFARYEGDEGSSGGGFAQRGQSHPPPHHRPPPFGGRGRANSGAQAWKWGGAAAPDADAEAMTPGTSRLKYVRAPMATPRSSTPPPKIVTE